MRRHLRNRRFLLLTTACSLAVAAALLALVSLHPGGDGRAEAHAPEGCSPGGDCVIDIGGLWFCDSDHENDPSQTPPGNPCDVTVQPGDAVTWQQLDNLRSHTVTECGDNLNPDDVSLCPSSWRFHSGTLPRKSPDDAAQTFSVTFTSADAGKTFLYRCEIHPRQMWGSVTVLEVPAETPTPSPTPTPTPTIAEEPAGTPTPTVTATPPPASTPPSAAALGATESPEQLPTAGSAPAQGGRSNPWTIIGPALALVAIASALVIQGLRSR